MLRLAIIGLSKEKKPLSTQWLAFIVNKRLSFYGRLCGFGADDKSSEIWELWNEAGVPGTNILLQPIAQRYPPGRNHAHRRLIENRSLIQFKKISAKSGSICVLLSKVPK